MTQLFDEKDPAEKWILEFDCSLDLAAGEALTGTPTVTVTLESGTDPTPNATLNGAPTLGNSNKSIFQPVQAGVHMCKYKFRASCATTNANKLLVIAGILPVRTA